MKFTSRAVEGHEDIVAKFKDGKGSVRNLPEGYVIQGDEYFANYSTGDKRWSKIHSRNEDVQDYIPEVGTLVRAEKLGRNEPDIFYKALIKGTDNMACAMHDGTHNPHCKILFVRTNLKQEYTKVHQLTLQVDGEYFDRVEKIAKLRSRPLLQHRLFLLNSRSQMDGIFTKCKTFYRAKRVSIARYFSNKARKEREERATPRWLTFQHLHEINQIMAHRKSLNIRDGKNSWHVDHIVPLKGVCDKTGLDAVSGLHVPWNLKVVPARDNLKKSNKFRVEG